MKKWRLKKSTRRWLSIVSVSGLIVAFSLIIYTERKLSNLVLGGLGEGFSTRLYAAPLKVDSLCPYPPSYVMRRLEHLNYVSVEDVPERPGQYHWDSPTLIIYARGFKTPFLSQRVQRVSLTYENHSWLDDADVALEPEIVSELSGDERIRRDPVKWEDIPVNLVSAVVAAEDNRFFTHWGVDPLAIIRAMGHNIMRPSRIQGASTITQQLVKNLFLTPRRTLWRKILEAFLAFYLDVRYSKERILTLYLNHIYMGQDGPVSIAGVKAAAQFYFKKEPQDLSMAECATLAGLIRSPNRYNPKRHPKASKDRRNIVLKQMQEEGMITKREYAAAVNTPLRTQSDESNIDAVRDEYFEAEVVRRLTPIYGEEILYRSGIHIYTTMDPILQDLCQNTVKRGANQAAMVVLDPKTGDVLAMAGGRNYRKSQFNRITQARRQPGSAFKPFVYGAALEEGFTNATLLVDEKRSYKDGKSKKGWEPRNFDDIYHGTVTLRHALAESMNAATLDLISKIGAQTVIAFARRMGIDSPLERSMALALGSSEVTPLELTAAYAPFVNDGFQVEPRFVRAVADAEHNILEIRSLHKKSVLDPLVAYLMTSLLQTSVKEGTAKVLGDYGWPYFSAGKTGTTNGGRDAWFIGYTAEFLAGVWVGDDESKAMRLAGSRHALPLWAAFMKKVYTDWGPAEFSKPEGIITISLDAETHLLAGPDCYSTIEEYFIAGTEPREVCPLH